jgi:hypothetical protein
MGWKKGNPMMWSQWAWVKIIVYWKRFSETSLWPRVLIPDPASIMIISSSFVLISRQVVLPPYFRYSFPETGIEPLAP